MTAPSILPSVTVAAARQFLGVRPQWKSPPVRQLAITEALALPTVRLPVKAQFTIDLSAAPAKRPSVLPRRGLPRRTRWAIWLVPVLVDHCWIVRIGVTAEVTGGDGTSDINAATFFRNAVVR